MLPIAYCFNYYLSQKDSNEEYYKTIYWLNNSKYIVYITLVTENVSKIFPNLF